MPLKPSKPTLIIKQINQIQALIIKIPQPHILNPFLKLLTRSSTPLNAFLLYNQMLHHYPSSYNHYTFTYALKACALAHAHHKGVEIHASVIKFGHLHDVFIQNALINFYVTEAEIFSANQIFYSIQYPDVVSWTTIISGLSKCGFYREAIYMFCAMNVRPNCNTIVSVISACSGLRLFKFGKCIHGYRLRNLHESNIILDNATLECYVCCGSLVSARYLFVNMLKRDVVSWTIMIGGYGRKGYCEEAVKVFHEMVQTKEAEPNEATLVNVLSACSSISALSMGEYVHSYISTRGDLLMSKLVGNAVINMYVKCGDVGMAVQVFNMLSCKDYISWSTLISGLAMNGRAKQALQLFSLMLVKGVAPDDITFIGLLSACSHGGLVKQGLTVFRAMSKVYEIVPQMQHYACMVDMYGRAGLIEEAGAFIREMPIEADGSVWGALLKACRIHGNDKMFERIRKELLNGKVRGVSVGTFALLSNTCASATRWEDANEVRDKMRLLGFKKEAGYSWIEVNPPISKDTDSVLN